MYIYTPQVTAPAVNASDSIPLPTASLRPGVAPKTERDRLHVVDFLRNVSCYAIMPDSGKVQIRTTCLCLYGDGSKEEIIFWFTYVRGPASHMCAQVVVLDTRVPTRLAFFALVEHGVTAASIFDELRNCHVGMLTSTDLIRWELVTSVAKLSASFTLHPCRILLHGYAHTALSKVFTMTIREWFATAASHKAKAVSAKKSEASKAAPARTGLQTVCHRDSAGESACVTHPSAQLHHIFVVVAAAAACQSHPETKAYQH